MPRFTRVAPGGVIYHVINRSNGRLKLFRKDSDYEAFLQVLADVKEKVPVRILAYCAMPDHWHLILHPKKDGELSSFMLRLTSAHVRQHHDQNPRAGGGHVYHGRFRNFAIQPDEHFLTVCRYVESNPVRAKLVKSADQWPWSSLQGRQSGQPEGLLDKWPVDEPADWLETVNATQDPKELDALRNCIARARPYGSEKWVNRTADKLGLEHTLRPPGRPRKVVAEVLRE